MPESQVDEIKSRLDIAEIIRGYMKLDKSGANLRGLCLFHKEKTPSFFVSPARQLWKCFGCGVGGDMLTFIMQIEGVDFKEALQILADRAGVQLKSYDPRVRSEKSRLYEICEKSCQFFEKQLAATSLGEEAKQYLLDRGIREESIKKFRLGFAPNSRSGVCDFLRAQGYSPAEICKAGVSVQTSNDRFRSRVMFPIFDLHSQVVGFGGRVFFAKNEIPNKNLAKYINTPQTLLYDKSKILYALDKAKLKVRERDSCMLVEGYTDAIMAHQAGSENVAAVSGTALTEQQLDLIHRYTQNLVTCFDMDIAGDNATKRGIEIAQRKGFNIKIILLPEGKDPAEIIQKNPSAWEKSIENALSIGDFYFNTTLAKFDKKTPDGIKNISGLILPMIKQFPTEIERVFWVQRLASELNCRENIVWQDLEKIPDPSFQNTHGKAPVLEQQNQTPQKTKRDMLYERLLVLLFKYPACTQLITKKHISFFAKEHTLASLCLKLFSLHAEGRDKKAALSIAEQDLLNNILFQNEIFPLFDDSIEAEEEFKICLMNLKQIELKEKLVNLQLNLRRNPQDTKLLEEFQKTSIELAKA